MGVPHHSHAYVLHEHLKFHQPTHVRNHIGLGLLEILPAAREYLPTELATLPCRTTTRRSEVRLSQTRGRWLVVKHHAAEGRN